MIKPGNQRKQMPRRRDSKRLQSSSNRSKRCSTIRPKLRTSKLRHRRNRLRKRLQRPKLNKKSKKRLRRSQHRSNRLKPIWPKLKRPKPPRLPLVGYMLFVPNAMNHAGSIISFAAGQGVRVILARQNSSCHSKMI